MRSLRSFRPALAAGALALTVIAAASPAAARPGTPNSEASWSPAPGLVTVRWQNTANEGGIVFDIEGQTDRSVANWAPPGGVGMGSIVSYTFANLSPGQHCFRVWSRKGVQGERSDQPSAFTCATVAGDNRRSGSGPTHPTPTPTPTPTPPHCQGLVCDGGGLVGRRG